MAKKADAWMPLYFGAYLTDTMHLTTEQHGAYLLMLMAAWKRGGSLPDDDVQLAAITRLSTQAWGRSRAVLASFWNIGGGEWRQKRLNDELDKANRLLGQKKVAGEASARKRWGSGVSNEEVTVVTTESVTDEQRLDAPSPLPSQTTKSKALSGKPDVDPLDKPKDLRAKAREILAFLNEKTGRRYQPVDANLELIVARLKEATEQELRQVIAKKCREWIGNEDMELYLRPETLFGRRKFAQYQGELENG